VYSIYVSLRVSLFIVFCIFIAFLFSCYLVCFATTQ